MSFWTAIVIIVAIGAFSEMYRARVKKSSERSERLCGDIADRMARLEDRMANVETLVLERERNAPFRELEGARR